MKQIILFSLSGFVHDHRALLFALLIGAIAGLLAQVLIPGRGFGMIVTIILGMIGGWLGSILFKSYLSFTHNAIIDHIICATVGAMILCIVINLIVGKDKGDKTAWKA